MTILSPVVGSGLRLGDSVAVNGVCLTVVSCSERGFECDLSAETLARTTLGSAREGYPVNLERPLLVGSRLGGHFVQGHVDGTGKLLMDIPSGQGHEMTFELPADLERYLVYKGSIAVDGISLTISALQPGRFSVSVIPHTMRSTNLKTLRTGDCVNLEVDVLGKYFERFFQLGLVDRKAGGLTEEYLKGQGF